MTDTAIKPEESIDGVRTQHSANGASVKFWLMPIVAAFALGLFGYFQMRKSLLTYLPNAEGAFPFERSLGSTAPILFLLVGLVGAGICVAFYGSKNWMEKALGFALVLGVALLVSAPSSVNQAKDEWSTAFKTWAEDTYAIQYDELTASPNSSFKDCPSAAFHENRQYLVNNGTCVAQLIPSSDDPTFGLLYKMDANSTAPTPYPHK